MSVLSSLGGGLPELNLQWTNDHFGRDMCVVTRSLAKEVKDPVGGKNIAVLEYTVNGKYDYILTVSDVNASKHSEPLIFEELFKTYNSLEKLKCVRLNWLYTERAPCGVGRGMRNCHGYLRKTLADLATHFGMGYSALNMPVYFTYHYPSDEECRLIAGSQKEFEDATCLSLKDYYYQVAKEERQKVTAQLKQEGMGF
jgi:hypothetical protein